MNLNPTTFKIDDAMTNLPIKKRYHWNIIIGHLKKLGFHRGDYLYWLARHPQIGEDDG